uniref:conjugal transfer protein n=1 Tax=Bacillaceae bacterium JMAK1 TaxID=1028381 RepID=UPI0003AC51F4|nr:conjugal transfer protein [Bacillaceae bacterium JMAK1]AGQ45426.1 Putative conjugative transposon membrane protein [Bacillaceae bacterium JMAK1]
MKNTYNYKKVFRYPITIYKITNYIQLPTGIALLRVVIFFSVFGFMILFNNFFLSIGSMIPGLTVVLYLGIPGLTAWALMKVEKDGKRVHTYLYELLTYLFTIYFPKKRFANDQEVLYSSEDAVTFEEFEVERKGQDDEIKNADQERS